MPPQSSFRIKQYVTVVDADVRLRRYLKITPDGVLHDFAVTLEHKVEEQWLAVARYDTAGGFVHRDRLSPTGEYLTHRETVSMGADWSDALNACAEDLMKRSSFYVSEFRKHL